MSRRVCYLERDDRGALLRRVRVVGAHTDDGWEAPRAGADAESVRQVSRTAAAWVSDRINGRNGGGARTLDRLCLDVDGAVCSWITANSGEARLIRAVIEQDAAQDADDPFAESGHATVGRFPDLPGEMTYQSLIGADKPPAGGGRARVPVFAIPDIAGRSLIDALDETGIQVGSCVSLWQAMMSVWASSSAASSQRVVAEAEAPLVAVVLCQPGERIIWAWGREGAPIAAGAFRTRLGVDAGPLRLPEGDEEMFETIRGPSHGASAGGRLAAEWLAWSAQIGRVPTRVTWVGPVHADAGSGLSGGEIAGALRKAAPGASVDIIDETDPIGLTLRRLAESLESPSAGPCEAGGACLVSLTNRPGRVHRAMYHWLAAVLLAAGLAIAAMAFSFWQRRGEAVEGLSRVQANQRELLERGAPELVTDRMALLNLRNQVDQARRRRIDSGQIPPPKPVLRELETIAFVLGNPDYELIEIDIKPMSVTFKVRVQDTLAFEQLQRSLFGIAGSSVAWIPLNPRQVSNKIEVTATGTWIREDRTGGES